MPRLTALKTNPNEIQIHQPSDWRFAPDGRGAPTLGNRSPNSSTLKELNQIHRRTRFNREPHEPRENNNRIPVRVFGVFRGSPSAAATPSELFFILPVHPA